MIIDVRCFLLVEEGELFPDWIIDYGVALSGSPREKVKERMEERKLDASGDLLVEDMDIVGQRRQEDINKRLKSIIL